MKCKVMVLGLTLVMALSLIGCGSRDNATVSEPVGTREPTEVIAEEGAPPTGRIAFHVRYVYPSGKVAKSAVVDKMRAYVYEPDGTKITQTDLEKVGDRGKASITVSAGDDRKVDLVAYDGSLVSWMGSDLDVDVVAGGTTTADVTMSRFVPTLAELGSPDLDGRYTVSWSAVQDATGYAVQESADGAFSSPRTVYQGTEATAAVVGKPDGTYWYRVRATGTYGEGMWCAAGSIEVAILGVPTLAAIPSPDGDGTYTVRWTAAAHAEGYVVEEDDNEAFSSPTQAYKGSALSVDRTGRAQGRYWYRVKATNTYGESAWSGAVSVEVVTEGTIDIDVPWPLEGDAPEGMVLIPAGTFQMGDALDEGHDDERPVHTMTLDGFYMDITEVTNAQYRIYDPSHGSGSYEGYGLDGDDQPVVWVSWWDAIKYCNWRSRQKGLEACYDESTGECDFTKNGYRLPTEAEWEHAAHGRLEGKRYPWGDEAPDAGGAYRANYGSDTCCPWQGNDRDGYYPTAPVGAYSPNRYGLYDIVGNVWEWCYDWYDSEYYSRSPESNATGPETGTTRVLRGGSWDNDPLSLRCADRYHYYPTGTFNNVGFRCVRSP